MALGIEMMSALNAVVGAATPSEAAQAWSSLAVGAGLMAGVGAQAVGFVHQLGVAAEEMNPQVAAALHDERSQLSIFIGSDDEEKAREVFARIQALIAQFGDGWDASRRRLAPDGRTWMASREAHAFEKETSMMRLCHSELSPQAKRNVIRTFQDHFGLESEEVRQVLHGMRGDGQSLAVWKKVPDTGHSPVAIEMIQQYYPDGVGRDSILTRNPYFISHMLSQTSGLSPYGEYDVIVRLMMRRHWEMFGDLPIRRIQLIHAIVYLDLELRLAYHHFPRSDKKLDAMARVAIGLTGETLNLLQSLRTEERRTLFDRWGNLLPRVLVSVGGNPERFQNFLRLTPEQKNAAYDWAVKKGLKIPENYGGLSVGAVGKTPIARLQLERHHLTQELVSCFLDGLNPLHEDNQEAVERRVREALNRFQDHAESPTQILNVPPIAWKVPWIPLSPDEEQVHRGRRILKKFGWYPGRIFELSPFTQNRLVRGGKYTGMVLPDGRIFVGLKTDETLLHLFLRLEETINIGERIPETQMMLLRKKLREPLVGAGFEFEVDGNGAAHLINQCSTYKTPVALMENVTQIFEIKGLKYFYDTGRQWR